MKLKLKSGRIIACLVAGLLATQNLYAQDVQSNMVKFGRLLRLVESYYVDSTNVDKLTEDAIVNMLGELDPHSVYISKEEVQQMNEPLVGNFEGIGISFNILRDTLMVVSIIPGGPSEKVGLMAGDRIMVIDGKPVAGVGLKNSEVTSMLRGDKGTRVDLKVQRRKSQELLDFTIIRDKIPIYSLDASYMLNEQTGYMKLNRFAATTTDEFLEAIRGLKKNRGMKNLVLDLRGNGGGYLKAAIELADNFLGANRLVVYTEGRNDPRKNYTATALGEFEQGRLLVLIDEGSASASEIVAGAIQDWDRGVIIGRRSFGKGLVQQPFALTDGSMVRLTTAHYYTPSGRCIQKPYDEGVEAYREDYMHRFRSGELFTADSIHFDNKQSYSTLKNKRTVYGGGGVMPDVFVPLDTSVNYVFYNQLARRNVINSNVLSYLDTNRERLQKTYADFGSFNQSFVSPDEVVQAMMADAEKEKIEKTPESEAFALPLIKRQIKALVARDLYGPGYYYQVINQDDEMIRKSIEVLDAAATYDKLLVQK